MGNVSLLLQTVIQCIVLSIGVNIGSLCFDGTTVSKEIKVFLLLIRFEYLN